MRRGRLLENKCDNFYNLLILHISPHSVILQPEAIIRTYAIKTESCKDVTKEMIKFKRSKPMRKS